MRPHGTQKQLEKRRRRAIEMLEGGMSRSAIARKLGCSPSSIHLWSEMHRKKGAEGLNPKQVPGRPHRLNAGQRKKLGRLLAQGPLALGYSTDLWTTRRATEVIRKHLGVSYHPNHLWRLLRGLGWSCQKPETKARERDEKKIREWKQGVWPALKKSPKIKGPSGVSG
jgi:transposase